MMSKVAFVFVSEACFGTAPMQFSSRLKCSLLGMIHKVATYDKYGDTYPFV